MNEAQVIKKGETDQYDFFLKLPNQLKTLKFDSRKKKKKMQPVDEIVKFLID